MFNKRGYVCTDRQYEATVLPRNLVVEAIPVLLLRKTLVLFMFSGGGLAHFFDRGAFQWLDIWSKE